MLVKINKAKLKSRKNNTIATVFWNHQLGPKRKLHQETLCANSLQKQTMKEDVSLCSLNSLGSHGLSFSTSFSPQVPLNFAGRIAVSE
jgi:hypothetical protein